MNSQGSLQTLDLSVEGMTCQDCADHVTSALKKVPGVVSVQVLVAAERATVTYDVDRTTADQLTAAVQESGYRVRDKSPAQTQVAQRDVGQIIGWGVLGIVALVVIVAALGERLGVFDEALEFLPWWVPAAAIIIGGFGVFRGVVQAALRRQITSHTLMTMGVIAAAAVGRGRLLP